MLKLVAGLVAGATLLTVGTVSAFASSQGNCFGGCQKTRVCDTANCSAQCYVDEDGDGVCDNRGTVCDGRYDVDVDQGGVCDNQGQNYVDANHDGICDNQGTHCNGGGAEREPGGGDYNLCLQLHLRPSQRLLFHHLLRGSPRGPSRGPVLWKIPDLHPDCGL